MKKVLSLNNVLFGLGSIAFVTTLLLVVTKFSFTAVILTAVFVLWIVTIFSVFFFSEKLEARWPWMKSKWFVITGRASAVGVIAIALYLMLT